MVYQVNGGILGRIKLMPNYTKVISLDCNYMVRNWESCVSLEGDINKIESYKAISWLFGGFIVIYIS